MQISGTLANHTRKIGSDYVAVAGNETLPLTATRAGSTVKVSFGDGVSHDIASEWTPGMPHGRFAVDGEALGIKIAKMSTGWRLRWRGIDRTIMVMTPRVFELSAFMPVKKVADTSKQLLCPMPGIITQVMVKAGDVVEAGQPLATVEAMKMENVLKAERKGAVKAVKASAGQSLAVDEVIMEFA
ncbi:biotin/lipoyl-containing protein [Aestuariivirga sp.]|uniref:biotin/lipoyl-containing protein n=1 Tax=Aestuariivirga sp. TaxID=2650926 RepID=UPI0039E2F6A8